MIHPPTEWASLADSTMGGVVEGVIVGLVLGGIGALLAMWRKVGILDRTLKDRLDAMETLLREQRDDDRRRIAVLEETTAAHSGQIAQLMAEHARQVGVCIARHGTD